MVCSFKEKGNMISTKATFFWEEKNHVIYTNPFYYAIISIFQAFTVQLLENETFKQSESLAFIWGEENRDGNLLTAYGCRKWTGKTTSRDWGPKWCLLQKASCYPECHSLASCFSCLLYSSHWFFLKSYQLLLATKTFPFWRGDGTDEHGLEQLTPLSIHLRRPRID